jgi:predicted HAD superfamily Cof-like phosphohydrolase
MDALMADVAEFHEACDVPVRVRPFLPDNNRRLLRLRLLSEELHELRTAEKLGDLAGIADGLADLIYVAVGMALEFGLPLAEVWAEVQAANMRKVDPETGKVKKRDDGKVLKPDGWEPPDVRAIIDWHQDITEDE